MKFEIDKVNEIERSLDDLVRGVKGVRHIRGCSDIESECYKISFGYQRRDPLKDYLLIYDPKDQKLTLCADGGVGIPPQDVRKRLLDRLGGEGYGRSFFGSIGSYFWEKMNINKIVN